MHEAGDTALHRAASWGRVDTVRLLLQHGADKTIRNKIGKTPLDLAKENAQTEVVNTLAADGTD